MSEQAIDSRQPGTLGHPPHKHLEGGEVPKWDTRHLVGEGSPEASIPTLRMEASRSHGVLFAVSGMCSQELEFTHLIRKGLHLYVTVLASVRIYAIRTSNGL